MLEEIRKLPQRVIDNLDGDIGNLRVYLVQDYDLRFLKQMIKFGQDIFLQNKKYYSHLIFGCLCLLGIWMYFSFSGYPTIIAP